MSELTFKNKKGKWVTYPEPQEQIEWLESEVERLEKALSKAENLTISDVSQQRELLKAFLEHIEETVDYLQCEPSVLIDDYFKSLS